MHRGKYERSLLRQSWAVLQLLQSLRCAVRLRCTVTHLTHAATVAASLWGALVASAGQPFQTGKVWCITLLGLGGTHPSIGHGLGGRSIFGWSPFLRLHKQRQLVIGVGRAPRQASKLAKARRPRSWNLCTGIGSLVAW